MTDHNRVTREKAEAAFSQFADCMNDQFKQQALQTAKLFAKITWLAHKIGITDDEWDEMNAHAEIAVTRAQLVVREEYEQKEGA